MIESGRYTITITGGTQITDYKKLFEDAPECPTVEGKGWPDGASQQITLTGITVPSKEDLTRLLEKPQTEPAHEIIHGKKYTLRQLEHFGDSVVGLAIRTLTYEKCGSDQRVYFHFTQQMVTNKNLGHGLAHKGTEAEIEIGRVFADQGLVASLEKASEIVKATQAWLKLVELLETE